jgi:opacity protein-like surface antigen
MRRFLLAHEHALCRASTLAAFICASLPIRQAGADELLGAYVGGAIGQAHVVASATYPSIVNVHPGEFDENHSAYKVVVGIRPISFVGAELSYNDFGNPSGELFYHPANVSIRGPAAFGVLYLPITILDIYAKAGVARLHDTLSGFFPNGDLVCAPGVPCGTVPFRLDRTNTTFAAGAGVQHKFGRWAVRAEYERFNADAEHPSVLSLGLIWTF